MRVFNLKQPFVWLSILAIIGLFAIKFESLFLPFFWDEAWVYMPAIRTMAEKGPGIMPGVIEADLYTGHPLLFYFLAGTWIKVFGYSLPTAHLLPLLISSGLLLSVFYVTYQWTKSYYAAFLGLLLVCIQPNFLTQSSFLLIEVWLGLLFVWSFYFYFQRNWIGFFIMVMMALWSKESAYCLVPAFGLLSLYEWINKRIVAKEFLKHVLVLVMVFFAGFSFFLIQKMNMGWYFFPRHANWINLAEFGGKIKVAVASVFVSDGRLYIFGTAILGWVIYQFIKKENLAKSAELYIGSGYLFAVIFMLFASINFFSSRYLLGAMPLLMIGNAIVISRIQFPKHVWIIPISIFLFGCNNYYISKYKKGFSDVDLSYIHLLKAEVDMVKYIQQKGIQENTYAPFLMLMNMTQPYSGMVETRMNQIKGNLTDDGLVYFIETANEYEEAFQELKQKENLTLVHRVVYEHAWVNLYKK